ncbi:MAG: hypothetical protein ACXWPM_09750 [Bdellovibrionota bacterium]
MWLVRTSLNEIAGPYTADQVRDLIASSALGLQDEICPANGYWIFLHEHEELHRLLGVQVPRSGELGTDEITQTETETETETVTEELQGTAESADDAPIPELGDVEGATTAISSNLALKRFLPKRPAQARPLSRPTGILSTSPPMERAAAWRGIALALVAISVIVVLAVLRLLRN